MHSSTNEFLDDTISMQFSIKQLNLKITTSLLYRYKFLDTLGSFIGIVHLGPLGKSGRFQITTVESFRSVLFDGIFTSSEVKSVDRNTCFGLGRFVTSLRSGFDNQLGLVLVRADNIKHFRVGDSGVLELIQGLDVSLLCTEFNST
jgi:hypothetical protein